MAEAYPPLPMGETAEEVADRWGVSCSDQDAFALRSQQRVAAAIAEGRFEGQIVAVSVAQPKGPPILVDQDEQPRPDSTADGLARL